MTGEQFDLGIGPAYERLQRLARRAEGLPADARAIVEELLEAFSVSVEQLQGASEALHQQKQALLATREEVEAQRRRYRNLLEFAPDGYLVTDPAALVVDANQAAVDLLHVPRVELLGKPLARYVAPGDHDRFHRHLDRVVEARGAGAREIEWELHIRPRRGPAFPAAVTVAPIRAVQGELTGLRWLLRDVTASKRAEERDRLLAEIQGLMVTLEAKRELLDTIMDNTPAQLAYLDPDFNFVRVNAAYVRGTGYSRAELLGANHFALFADAENQAIFEQVRDTGEPVSFEAKPFEFPGQRERGTTYWDWALVPVKDEAGGVRGLVLSATDVTAEVRARQERERLLVQIHEEQQRTEEANRLLQAIIETMPAGAVISDAGGHVFLTNSTGRDILGAAVHGTVDAPERPYTPHYPDGTPMPPDDMPLAHALAERRVVRDVEIRIRRNDGSERTILAAAAPVLDEEGELTSGVTLFLDITARKQIQAERERLLAILEQTPDLVAMVRADGDLIYLNRAARQAVDLADYPRDSLPAHGFPLEHPSWARRLVEEEGIPTAIAQGVWRGRTAIVDGDGAEIPLSQIIIAHPGPKGKVAYLSTVARDVSEREHILAALQEERARFQAIFENAPEAILVAGAGGRIVLANEAAQALFHRPVPFGEPFTPADVVQVLHPDGTPFEPDDYPILRAALRGEHVGHTELTVIWDEGERRDLLVSAAPLRDVDGGSLGAVTLMQDITDQKETQRALATYADRLHTLHIADQVILSAESADEIVDAVLPLVRELVACRQASVLAFDREAAEIEVLGVDAAGETRLQRGARLPLDEGWRLEALARGELAALDDVPDASIEPVRIEALRADGLYTYVNVPLVARGELLGVLNLAADEGHTLTAGQREIVRQMADQLAIGLWQARLHAQVQRHTGRLEEMVTLRTAALRSSEARFRAIFESAALGIALLDETGHILNSNPALQQLLGYSGEALRNRALEEFTHPADRSGDAGLYAKLMAGEYEFYRIEKHYRRSDGRPLVSALTMSLVQRGSHSTPLAIAMIEDITEQKKTQQALIQSEKLALVGQLGASLTHEINNPLQGAIGCLGLAEEMVEEDGSLDQYLNIAIEELRRAARIVRQLGDLGRPSEEEFEHQPIDVEEQLDQILVLARNYCQKRRVTIGRTPADDRPIVLVEPDRIRQVFLNMVLNAADGMPEGGHLGIATTRTHDPAGIAVTFTDTGVGIDRKTLPHIFEPFYTTRPDGLGLGLYISKTIVEDHGGRIDVESEFGKGTTFTVWLPA